MAAACGGGGGTTGETVDPGAAAQGDTAAGSGSSVIAFSPRPADGISATGGTLQPGEPCDADAAADPIAVAWVSPKLEELADIGLETLVYDNPSLIVEAYINALNSQGGINGRCLVYLEYLWGLADPQADFGRICSELPQQQPLLLLALALNSTTFQCVTLAGQIPTLGLSTWLPESSFAAANGLLFVDQGSPAYLVSAAIVGSLEAGSLTSGDKLGLLYEEGRDGAAALQAVRRQTGRLDLDISAEAAVPAEFGDLGVLRTERQIGLLRHDRTVEERDEADEVIAALDPQLAGILRQIEPLYKATADWFRVSGVTAVVSTAGWSDVRRLMRAAETVGWYPKWIINDSQPVSLVLTEVPKDQAANLLQVSYRRSPDDAIPPLDRGCASLRNTSVIAEPFAHRNHTDAWNLMNDACDFLDVVFGAMARIDGEISREALVQAMSRTTYQTANGSRIEFSDEDRYGADRFRILRADPDCVLNSWGCMRADSDWLAMSASDLE